MYLCMYIYSMNTYALTWAALLCSGALKGRLSIFSLSYLKLWNNRNVHISTLTGNVCHCGVVA